MIKDQVPDALKAAEEIVTQLYDYRDSYIEIHGVENCHKKNEDIELRLKAALAKLDHLQLSIDNKALFFYLRGKVLNITPTFDQRAEECLSKAVKLDPTLIEAWNQLGESYWKNQNIAAAANCFSGAIAKSRNKVSLRNLSMVQRQLGTNYNEKVKNIRLSVETAKEAVSMDLLDGHSWFVLGNAYLSVFFFAGQSPSSLKLCMSAYIRAEMDKISSNNPDLHYNRAVAYKYQEQFIKAVEGYKHAILLDPSWKKPQEDYQDIVQRLKLSNEMIRNKGYLKPKKLSNLINHIKESDLGPFLCGKYTNAMNKSVSLKCVLIRDLTLNCNENTVVHGKVIATIPVKDGVPFPFILIDSTGKCIAVSVFNLAVGKGFIIGDSIAIPEPFVQQNEITLDGESLSFQSIRVDNPVVLVINKRKVGTERLACSVLSVTNKCD